MVETNRADKTQINKVLAGLDETTDQLYKQTLQRAIEKTNTPQAFGRGMKDEVTIKKDPST
jgi:hypothetical protein